MALAAAGRRYVPSERIPGNDPSETTSFPACPSPPKHKRNYLVLVAGPLAVLGEALQGLVDEGDVLLVDVEPEQAEAAGGAAADAVQELQGLAHQVVVGLVVLATEEVLPLGSPQVGGAIQRQEGKGQSPRTVWTVSDWPAPRPTGGYAEGGSAGRSGRVGHASVYGRGHQRWLALWGTLMWDALEGGGVALP